jgi:hypothetical protein
MGGWVRGSAVSTYVQVHRAVKQHLQTARAALETIVTAALHLLLLLPLLKNLNPQDCPDLERRCCRCRYLHFWRCHDGSLLQTSWSDDTLPRPPQHLLLLLQNESSFFEYYLDYKGIRACTGASQLVASSSCAPKPYLARLGS